MLYVAEIELCYDLIYLESKYSIMKQVIVLKP